MPQTRETSLALGIGLAVAVVAIYDHQLPSLAETRVNAEAGDRELAASERSATWTAAILVTAVSLIAKDVTAFVFGGATIVAHAWLHRHANHYSPELGAVAVPQTASITPSADYQPTVG
jgi:hypothetical protein